MLGCGCVCFGVGVRVRVKRILPWRGGMWSGVLRECSLSKYVCSMSTIWDGCVVTSWVVGSRMASSLGWSLALGCRPATV